MLKLMWTISLFYAAGCQELLVAHPGQNVSLTCNLTSGHEVLWFRLQSNQLLLPLLTVIKTKVDGDTVNVLEADQRLSAGGHIESGMVSLDIQEVQQEDAGLYYCMKRNTGDQWSFEALQLTVHGAIGPPDVVKQPCWTTGLCMLPAAIVFGTFVFAGGVYLCSGECNTDFVKSQFFLSQTD
ncbi:unnamed protein product [Ophioblennius macclurei]